MADRAEDVTRMELRAAPPSSLSPGPHDRQQEAWLGSRSILRCYRKKRRLVMQEAVYAKSYLTENKWLNHVHGKCSRPEKIGKTYDVYENRIVKIGHVGNTYDLDENKQVKCSILRC